jgi:hypothetical protein
MKKVSIIIVHYKEKKILYDCLKSINNSAPSVPFEIIVVDNDEIKTVESYLKTHFPDVRYIASPGDLGYGKGNNLGIKSAKGEYIFILNPDTLVTKGMVEAMLAFIEKNKNVGAVAPSLYDQHGKVYPSQGTGSLTPIRGIFGLSFLNKIFPNNPISKAYWLKEINRDNPYEVDVVPGTAFMIKKSLFDKLGGFDKNFFLYFEESDLCKRIKEAGYKLFILPQARLTHFWAVSTPPSDAISKIFRESRLYYFKKNFGILNALLVEFFARLSLVSVLLFFIVALGIFLRFYRLQQNMLFNGEMGYDYTTIKTFVESRTIPLIGPRTSHEWFFIGPLFYWIFGILFPLFNYNVAVGAYFFAIVGALSIPICYFVVKSLFGKKVGIISAFLLSFSPLWITLARDARFNAVTAILFFPFYYFLVKSTKEKGKSLFILGIILGIMFSFFPSPILLLPGSLVVIYIYRKQIIKKYLLLGLLGFLIPNIPYLIYNATHKFEILKNLFMWIPYRVLGFFGLYPKNTVSTNVIKDNIVGLYTFFQQSYLNSNNIFISILVISLLIFTIKSLKKNQPLQILLILSGISYLGLFLHGSPPQHYYLVIFPVPIILLSLLIEKLGKKWIWLSILILGYLLFINLKFYFSKDWFYIDSTRMSQDMNYVPYSLQMKVVNFIANDSNNKKFSLSRIGPLDYFGENFSLNYQYLLWNLNHKTVQDSKLKYTIYEDTTKIPENQKIYWVENIAITKNE